MENYILDDLISFDNYTSVYAGYDKKRKRNCFITLPNVETSWTFQITY